MSYHDFDYEHALNLIKASLFDIYESQERIIGSLEDEKMRAKQIEKYIKMKDKAITLLEDIIDLYDQDKNKLEKIEDNNKEIPKETTTPKVVEIEPEEVSSNAQKSDIEELKEENDLINQENNKFLEIEEQEPLIENESSSKIEEELKEDKFYLDDRNGTKPNFAYVPPSLFEIIKKNGNLIRTDNEELEIEEKEKLYKTDENQAKGIIVRMDQFMKLSLSRHRQEGVLIDAKNYRREQAKKSRKQRLEEEREKMNAKVKSLKAA